MSSFIVKPETINRIVSYITSASRNHTIYYEGFNRQVKDLSGKYSVDFDSLAEKLFELNVQAVRERYGDETYETMPGPRPISPNLYNGALMPSSPIRVYKSLQCLIYQCSEGKVPQMPLYKFLTGLKNILANQIVSQMPEYDKAEWD